MRKREALPTLLFQHWVGHRELVVSRFAAPMSVRDQIVRARLLARHVVDAGVVGNRALDGSSTGGPTNGAVVVVGAGAAGVSFAVEILRATKAWPELVVVVIERGRALLTQQGNAPHRTLDPTLYDWPAPHWTMSTYPLPGDDAFPLGYERGLATTAAAAWRGGLGAEASRRLRVVFGATVDFDRPRRRGARHRARSITSVKAREGDTVTVADGWTAVPRPASPASIRRKDCVLVVHAFGIGKERVFIEGQPRRARYRCPEFWSDDGVGSSARRRVLVSGGGDGAIQDFIRLSTGCRDPKELVTSVFADAAEDVLDEVGRAVGSAVEDEIATWLAGSPTDASLAAARLEAAMSDALDGQEAHRRGVFDAARARVHALAADRHVTVVHRNPVYDHCYALNRLSALLLFRLLGEARVARRVSTELVDVCSASRAHTCGDSATTCARYPHTATLKTDEREPDSSQFDVVVIRHGTLPSDPGNDPLIRRVAGLIPSTGWRQTLPVRLAPLAPS